jgi:hypothetical protein
MEPVTLTITLGVLVFALLSARHHIKQRKYLLNVIPANEEEINSIKRNYGDDLLVGTAVGVTVFDVLYNTSKMDVFALAGMNHLHHSQEFSSFSDLSEFMKENIINSPEGTQAWRDMVHKYKGYTGEEAVFDKLEAEGHDVQIPESGTQEGYDMILDGTPMNIKITDNPSYIQEHLDKYPDIPVYTNAEMKEAFANNPNVSAPGLNFLKSPV